MSKAGTWFRLTESVPEEGSIETRRSVAPSPRGRLTSRTRFVAPGELAACGGYVLAPRAADKR